MVFRFAPGNSGPAGGPLVVSGRLEAPKPSRSSRQTSASELAACKLGDQNKRPSAAGPGPAFWLESTADRRSDAPPVSLSERPSLFRRAPVWIFLGTAAVALVFAFYTRHVWEDYYITFRSSRNLATGHGLVFNPGDRLHTFTSPLGVLLPALTSVLTLNASDEAALWGFRLCCIGALAGGVTLFFASLRTLGYAPAAGVLIAAAIAIDAKNVDFAINGMESAFLLLFFAYGFWAVFVARDRRAWHLGVAWGGLMWTRPDGFVYIAAFAIGLWLFNEPARTGGSRLAWLRLCLHAGVVATAVYLPWLLFAWAYYGTPVPQPVVAKALQAGPKTLSGFLDALLGFPLSIKSPYGPLHQMYLPTYAVFGGWPAGVRIAGMLLSAAAALLWPVRRLHVETRAASFTYFCASFYLSYFPPAPFPWYLCLPATIGLVALGTALAQAWSGLRRAPVALVRWAGLTAGALAVAAFFAFASWCTVASARQMKLQQQLIENGTRRQIGIWLRQHAAPGDTVFLEPVGYIGYFSGLRMYDFPGLTSREVVGAIRRVGPSWGAVVLDLRPAWLVLRPFEADAIAAGYPNLLPARYELVREFNVRNQVLHADVQGREYLLVDSDFLIFKAR